MSQVASWSVEGVDSQTREAATILARRSGMTLAQWLKTTVAEQKLHEPPLFEAQSDLPESPLAAIARRLAKTEGRYSGSDSEKPMLGSRTVEVSAAVLARHIRASEARMAGLIEQLIHRQEQSEAQLAALVDALVDGFAGRPASAAPAGADDALDALTRDLEQRIAGMADRIGSSVAAPSASPAPRDDLSEQIAALTREVAELRRSHPPAASSQEDLAGLRAEVADLSRHVANIRSPEQFARLDKKLDLLARQAQDPAVLAALQRETADIRARLGDLVRHPESAHDLHEKIDALRQVVDDMQSSTDASLTGLMARLEGLNGRVVDEAAFSALERQIAAMAGSIEGLAGGGPGPAQMREAFGETLAGSALAALPEELQRIYRELRQYQQDDVRDTRAALDALQSLLHQLGTRLSAVEDLIRSRGGAVVAGPPDLSEVPPLFGRERPDDVTWSDDLPRSLAGDGLRSSFADTPHNSSRPSQVSALGAGGSPPPGGTRSAFIAAARRAARAANEAEGAITREENDPVTGGEPFYKRHKRPILLGLAAVTMMLGALQGGKAGAAPSSRPVTRLSTSAAPQMRPAIAIPKPEQAGQALAWFEEARRLDRPDAPTQDLAKAAGLYRQAAQMGYTPALFLLGRAYDKGRGVGQDAVLAGLWYQRAAEHGSVNAMYNLAVLYANGSVMGAPDYEQAARWFHQAAEKGHVASQYNYALLAARGLGTPRDLAVSYRFLALAAAAGDADALMKLAEIEPRLTPSQRAALDSGKAAHHPC
ncbi:tetratricopeptide repeat protein [Labrys okinawensis]|nr:tetratricopeptide repeat protein [Labrys okinawensis]